MKKSYKLLLINVVITLLISLLFALTTGLPGVFIIALGAVSGLLGLLNVLIGLLLLAADSKERSQAFLLSGGVLFLLGVGICGSMFIFM